jgi:1,4-alpha-glucan branching enzyme
MSDGQNPVWDQTSLISEDDQHLFNEGRHYRLYEKLGSHPGRVNDTKGVHFALWAPNAHGVFVHGDFNGWDQHSHALHLRGQSGIWEGFVPGAQVGQAYKYHIESNWKAYQVNKADPMANWSEVPPYTASRVADMKYTWGDADWLEQRKTRDHLAEPMSTYELHLGSWRRGENGQPLSYREIAPQLAEYAVDLGYSHVELMPVMEHPFAGSWGYQVTGFFAPTSRFGPPTDFMHLIDTLHQAGIGVILDWVPSHFPTDQHGLYFFDGTHLYEHADPRKGHQPDWDSAIFNYGRNEVRSFLYSSANFWLRTMHADGLRVDAVASMLYLDYSREEGEWIPNKYGGNENLEAVDFLRDLNSDVYGDIPGVTTIAEESTAWPMVSKPTYLGGLGFGFKWDMGWMHDTLQYLRNDPVHRKFHHDQLTFRMLYAFTENFVMALSHDEVVHMKGSLLNKMPGDEWQQFANLRLLLAYLYAQPGKKLLFMGGEIGQRAEWNHDGQLDWPLLQHQKHTGVQNLTRDLNRIYRQHSAMHELDCHSGGFEWVDCADSQNSVLCFLRKGKKPDDQILAVFNFTPVVREGYAVGVDQPGKWTELLNTDAEYYWGSGVGNLGSLQATDQTKHGRSSSLVLTLPPLSALLLIPTKDRV